MGLFSLPKISADIFFVSICFKISASPKTLTIIFAESGIFFKSLVFIESTAYINKDSESISVTAQAGIDPNRKGMDIGQSFGSSSSYARKYALNGLFLIDDSALDPDASNDHQPKSEQPTRLVALVKDSDEWKKVLKYVIANKSKGLSFIGKQLNTQYNMSIELKKEIAELCSQ